MARGGRRSHPPKPEADRSEKVNVKERRKAIRSAIAATSSIELVRARGHLFARDLPVVVQSEAEALSKTSEVKKFLEAAGLWQDVGRTAHRLDGVIPAEACCKRLPGDETMIIKSPYVTEKVTAMIDSNNTLEFLVNMRSTKPEIKKALEELYDVEVLSVRTMITSRGEKKAVVKLARENAANELATRLGLL
jgi:ribosomal protein uL23